MCLQRCTKWWCGLVYPLIGGWHALDQLHVISSGSILRSVASLFDWKNISSGLQNSIGRIVCVFPISIVQELLNSLYSSVLSPADFSSNCGQSRAHLSLEIVLRGKFESSFRVNFELNGYLMILLTLIKLIWTTDALTLV